MIKQLSNGNPDGQILGYSGDKLSFFGRIPVPQRSAPNQALLGLVGGAMIVTYQETLTPALIAGITTAEQALTVGTTAGWGPLTSDFVAAINKPTSQAGIGIHSGRISAANTLQFVYSNTTGGNLTPTAGEIYNVVLLRGFPIVSQALTPASVPAATTREQIFTITPTVATGTATIANGKVTAITITSGGANYWRSPTIRIDGIDNTQGVKSGTNTGTGNDPSLTGESTDASGVGATAEAIVVAGVVIGARITNPGSGYTVAPTVTFVGGNSIQEGMALMITKPTTNAGVAIGGCRVVGDNQIGITFVNPTAAAVTPTAAETYSMMALNPIPVTSNFLVYGAVATGIASVATTTSTEQAITVTGLLATDIVVGINKPTLQAQLVPGGCRVSANNTLQVGFGNCGAGFVTPVTTEVYGVTVFRQMPIPPFVIYKQLLTPVSVAANTTAEQTFTVTGLVAGSTVIVNKPSHQQGLAIGGVRVSAASTLAITFENVTAAAITPTAEVYTIGNFTSPGPGGGVIGNWAGVPVNGAIVRELDLVNEIQTVLTNNGLIRG